MDNYDGNPSLGGEPAMDTGDWRCQLQADSREIIVNKISGTLKRHLPLSGQEGLVELKKIAVRFEEKIYAAATSQSDYLRKISLKMLTMETKSQNTVTSSLQSNSAGSSVMQPQVTNQGQLLSENIQSNIPHSGIQFSAGLSSAQAPTPALNMSALLSALPPSPGTDASISSALPSPQGINMSSSSSELFPAYGLIQSESSSALSPAWSLNVLANYPLASSHQSPVQSASLAEQSFRLQQNQQSAIPHLTESMLQQTAMPQQHQAQQLIATLDSTAQIGDENGAEWQEEVYQKIKVMKEMYLTKLTEIYQKNAIKLEQLESLPQQPKLYRLEKLKIHKTMLEHLITVLQVSRSNISPVLKGKLGLYEKQIISFINTNKPKKPDSSLQQGQLTVPSMGHSHSHATQVQSPENQMNPQLQSMNLQSSVPTMQQNNITGLQQNSMSSLSGDSTAQTGHTNRADWQEEAYQKIKVMKEMYYPELSEMYQKIASKLHQHDSLPQQPKSEQLEKLKMFKAMLERLITVLQISKSNVSPGMKEKLNVYEKQIINFINTNRPRKPVSTLQPGQLPPPHMQSMQQSQSQINQVQSHENQMNPQLQSMNLQGSVPTMQQNNMTGLQQNSMSSLSGVSTAQQNMMNPLQPSSNMDPGQGTSLNSLQQNGINMLQNNINPLQSNPGILHSQHLKQQEHQLYHNQLKQQYQQRQMQQQLMQKQQIIQQQLQLQQQAKQQLPGQLQAHQMPQLHQISDVDDVKNRPGSVKPGTFLSGDGLRQNSVSSLSGVSTQQNMMNPLQSSSNADPGQGVSHQLNAGFLHNRFLQQQQQLRLMFLQSQQRQLQEQLMQKNQIFQQGQQQEIQHLLRKLEPELPQVNVVNDMNTSALLSSQSESNMLQGSIDSLNSSSRMGDNKQHQKQEQEEKVFQNQLKQPYQQLQMQQQWTQKPQMLQEKQQQQIQQLQQQTKQQLHHIYFIYLIFLAILLGAYLFGTGY